MSECRFVFVMPAYNAEKTIQQALLSVVAQSYPHWKIIIRDDMSTDETVKVATIFRDYLRLNDKIEIQVNTEKKWEVQNVLEMIAQCKDDDVVCRLDADDWLTDLDVLTILNYRYSVEKFDAVWTSHRWSFSDTNISGPMPPETNVYYYPWVSSHFKTFRKKLINGVSDHNFRDQNGNYFKRIGDQAIYLPVLNRARKRLHEPIVAYHYTIDTDAKTFQTDDAKYQKQEAEFLRDRQLVHDTVYGTLCRGKFHDGGAHLKSIAKDKTKISFIFYRCFQPDRGVVHMRAVTPAYYIDHHTATEAFCEQTPNEKLGRGDIAVFVKHVNPEELARATEKGCITVFDPVDNFFDLHVKNFDVVIACNDVHAWWLQKEFSTSKIIIIDHLHTNIGGVLNRRPLENAWVNTGKPCKVKYVGEITSMSKNAINALEKIQSKGICEWGFVQSHQFQPSNLSSMYSDVDAGVIFADESCDDPAPVGFTHASTRKLLKPSNKLTGFMSFGIPVVFNFHESYQKILQKHPRMRELCVESIDEIEGKIRRLASDKEFYKEMSDLFCHAADDFHMHNAYNLYVKQILDLGIKK